MDKLIDALYSRFLLRDLFGKIVPGWLTIAAVPPLADILLPDGGSTMANVATGSICAGVAWVIAFALQALGDWTQILMYHPKRYSEYETRYKLRVRFDREASEREKQQVERLVVIKEATGTGSLSLFILSISQVTSAVVAIRTGNEFWMNFFITIVLAMVGWLLLRSHKAHAIREYNYIEIVLNVAYQ